MRSQEVITELFDRPYALRWRGVGTALARDDEDRVLEFEFSFWPDTDTLELAFSRGGRTDATGQGDAARVFATAIQAMREFLAQRRPPRRIEFTAQDTSRVGLYQRMADRLASDYGYRRVAPLTYERS